MAALGVILVLIGATLMVAEALLRAITGPRGGDAARALIHGEQRTADVLQRWLDEHEANRS